MSFAKAMKPTPSEVSLASTAHSNYSTPGQAYGIEDVPPVPPIPQVYAPPFAEEVNDDNEDQKSWPLPTRPQAPTPSANPYEFEPETWTAQSTPASANTRQRNFDKALAHLEGRDVEPEPNSDGESISSRERRKEAKMNEAERERRRYERFNKRSAKKKKAAGPEDEPMIEPAAASIAPGYVPREAPQAHPAVAPQQQYPRQPALDSPAEHFHPVATANCFKNFDCAGVSADERAADPSKYYPYVCHPSKLDGAAWLLKSVGKKTRGLLRIQRPPGLAAVYADWMANLTPEQRAMVAPEIYGAEAMARYSPRIGGVDARDFAAEAQPVVPVLDTSGQPGPSRPPVKEGMYKGIPLPAEPQKKAPVISLEEAQQRFLGHAERNPIFVAATTPVRSEMPAPRPAPPVKVVGNPDRGTMWGDFIAAGEPGDLPATAEETFSPTPPFATAPQLAAEYRNEISPKGYSPVGFSAMQEAYPTGRRVLYEPELSSRFNMPRFDENYPWTEDVLVGDAEVLSQSSRQDRQRGYRARNVSRENLAEVLESEAEKAVRRQKRRERRERGGREEALHDGRSFKEV